MEHILTGLYNKPTNNSRRPPRGAYSRQMRQPRLATSQRQPARPWPGFFCR
ncbi:MAG: hypothetical protein ACMX3H_01625 [Sodalis sp. (in: enterobacteria)]|uniref:hypothetical protein n=1 Tax=Sodalis sp. (in: enterobacteria) TaxID=1898979 RepID=UPI0039E40E29